MKFKRVCAMLLTTVMMMGTMAACGSSDGQSSGSDASAQESTEIPQKRRMHPPRMEKRRIRNLPAEPSRCW